MRMQTGAATVESSEDLTQKITHKTDLWTSNFTPGNLFEENQNTNLKEYMHTYVHCSIIYTSQDLEATEVD